ncbi:MAG TPA: carboxypeptidase regulatory-like domain-containing protein [Bryobacteraceae bacterium]|jgi:hypothetical protein
MKLLAIWILGFLLYLSSPASLMAQATTGTITGQVTDSSNAVVANADVRITDEATGIGRDIKTNETGFYVFSNMLPAVYDISVSAPGFNTTVQKHLELLVRAGLRADFKLVVGTVSQTLTVTSAAAPLIEAESAKIGTIMEPKQITELPLNGRNFAQLVLLTPGALPIALGQSTLFKVQLGAGSFSPVINGQRSRYNNFTLDGVEDNDPMFNSYALNPSVDAIQEFTVQSRGGVAEQGRSVGSDVIVATRSGGNQFHGALWEYLRNDKLDARNFFDPERPAYKQNQFGGTFGGPVRLPHYNGRDRTFFFGYYEGYRSVRSANSITTVPTAAEVTGDFSAPGLPTLYDINTTRADPSSPSDFSRNVFPGNRIPQNRIDANSVEVLKSVYPQPNLPGLVNNYINTLGSTTNNDQGSLRIDHKFTDENNFFGRISYNNGNQALPGDIPSVTATLTNVAWNATASDSYILKPNVVAHFQFGFNRYTSNQGGGALPNSILAATGWDKVFPPGPPDNLVLGLSIADISSSGGYTIPIGPHTSTQAITDLTWIRGRHNLKLGLTWNTLHSYQASPQAGLSFSRNPTSDLVDLTNTGYGPATFLLGLPSSARCACGDSSARLSNNEYHGFVQDDVRMTPKFTLSVGLRYSYVQAMKVARDEYAELDPLTGDYLVATKNPITGADPNVRARLVDPDWRNFAPRLGIAYLLNARTTIRAGAGIFYSYTDYPQNFGAMAGNWPFGLSLSADPLNAYVADTSMENPFEGFTGPNLPPSPAGQGGYSSNPRMKTPYSIQRNFSIQHELPSGILLEADYVGSQTVNTLQALTYNLALPGPGPVQPRRRWPEYSQISFQLNGSPSNYNGLSLKFQKRYSNGLSILSSYTWSHNLDVFSTERNGGTGVQDPLNWRADYATSVADVRQAFLFSDVYELPFGRGKHWLNSGLASYVLGNWQWSNIIGLYGGQPINITLGFDNANIGTSSAQRPNLDGNPVPTNQTRELWINKSAFAVPAPFTYGDAGRNIMLGPSRTNWDMSLAKNFPINETMRLQFRCDLFNTFNIVNFGPPDSILSSAGFGVITSAGPARDIQLSLKLTF